MTDRYVCFLLVLVLPSIAFAQKRAIDLVGTLKVKDGDTYKYELVLKDKKSGLSGYSLTWLGGDKPSKAYVKGKMDLEKHSFYFIETKVAEKDTNSGSDMCLVMANMVDKMVKGKHQLVGKFIGRDAGNNVCGTGEIVFQLPDDAAIFDQPEKDTTQVPLVVADVKTAQVIPGIMDSVTEGIVKTMEWGSDTCKLYIWDNGAEDGDIVSVTFNGIELAKSYTLKKDRKLLVLPLLPGTNTLLIKAENTGRIPPNTARLLFTGNGADVDMTAYNQAGKSAEVRIERK